MWERKKNVHWHVTTHIHKKVTDEKIILPLNPFMCQIQVTQTHPQEKCKTICKLYNTNTYTNATYYVNIVHGDVKA